MEFAFFGAISSHPTADKLRQSPALRALVRETRLSVSQLVLPLFVRAGRKLQ